MSGTVEGGKKAVESVRKRYGDDHYRQIGAIGGSRGRGGGFTGRPDLARHAGRLGGRISRRGVKLTSEQIDSHRSAYDATYRHLLAIHTKAQGGN